MSGDDYLRPNRAYWNRMADEYAARAGAAWRQDEPTWGIWGIPDRQLDLLRGVAAGRDVLEDGCGTAYVSAWIARRGARVVGLDNSPAQLATARRLQREHGLHFALVHAAGERLPFAAASFDVVISEYGAAIWADPEFWIPEAARVLRPGGELVFLANSTLLVLCMPDHDADLPAKRELRRDQFSLHRVEWPDDGNVEFSSEPRQGSAPHRSPPSPPQAVSVEFHLSHGDWIRLFRANGLEVEDLLELRPREDATTRYDFVTLEWARRWPSEEVWRVRKRR